MHCEHFRFKNQEIQLSKWKCSNLDFLQLFQLKYIMGKFMKHFFRDFRFMKKNFPKKKKFHEIFFSLTLYITTNMAFWRLPKYKECQIPPWGQYWSFHWDHMEWGKLHFLEQNGAKYFQTLMFEQQSCISISKFVKI